MTLVILAFLAGMGVQAPMDQSASTTSQVEPDVAIRATLRVDSIRWRQTGSLRIGAYAEPGGLEIEESLATGIPAPIPAGRTFRNLDWRLDASARIDPAAVIPASPDAETPTPQTNND